MKLEKVLGILNQVEKGSFLKTIDHLCSINKADNPEIENILSDSHIKNIDEKDISELFNMLKDDYKNILIENIKFNNYHLGLLIEIFIRDGNQIMSREWFDKLYENEILNLNNKINEMSNHINATSSDIDPQRIRDYIIYKNCMHTAYTNDKEKKREANLSWEEKTLLNTLADSLELSNEEQRCIKFLVLPLEKFQLDDILYKLKDSGIVFFNKKTNTLFIPDEIISILRDILNIELPNKYIRRILKHLKDSEINYLARKHNINRTLKRHEKINDLLKQGLNVFTVLSNDIFKNDLNKLERTKRIQNLIADDLELDLEKFGRSLEEKIENLIQYFKNLENDDNTILSQDGFKSFLEAITIIPNINDKIKEEFEIQDNNVLDIELLDNYKISPRDILYLFKKEELQSICTANNIKSRGNLIDNILENFRNIEDLYLENFEDVGNRNINTLKEKGLNIKESELGLLYEDLTKRIFTELGFQVDDTLKSKLSTSKNKMDILLNLGNNDVIIIECKTIKDRDYNKYSSVSRQLKSYVETCEEKDNTVRHCILVSNSFSDDFISECEYDSAVNISLVSSKDLIKILSGLDSSPHSILPSKLLEKKGILNADSIVKALNR